MAECPGYEPQQLKLHNKAQGWVWGNILLGGVVGLIVDCSSGASDELIPKEVHFNFGNPQMTTREATKIEEKDKKTPEPSTHTQEKPLLVVKGIVYSESNPSALVGELIPPGVVGDVQSVHKGDVVAGAKITRITKDAVEFEMDGGKVWRQNVER